MAPAHAPATTHANGFVLHQRDELLQALERIDVEGWNGPTATALLQTVRADVVRSLVRIAGLRGLVASQAEASGWAMAWETLRRPSLRQADSPWGVLWVAVRRAVFGERLAAEYATNARTAYRLCSRATGREALSMWSLDVVTAEGCEGFAVDLHPSETAGLLDHLADAFTRAGWPDGLARQLIHQIAVTAERPRPLDVASGWRHLAVEMGIHPWQARRAMVLILGSPGCAGLAERVLREGAHVLQSDDVRQALQGTLRVSRCRRRAA
jgi:hypothetical protein